MTLKTKTLYRVLKHSNKEVFELLIQDAINDGWQLQGGVGHMIVENQYIQAIAKTESRENLRTEQAL